MKVASLFFLSAAATLANGDRESKPSGKVLLSQSRAAEAADPDAERFKRESWLASHLKDVFEMDRNGRLAPQSGLNIAWNHEETKVRNSRDDCGEGDSSVVAQNERLMKEAVKRGKLEATKSTR